MTIIQYRDDVPTWAEHSVDPDTGDPVEVWVEAWQDRYAYLRASEAVTLRHERVDRSIAETMIARGWTLADVGGDPVPLPDAYHRAHSPIFRYAILHPVSLKDTACAFLATASGEWSRERAKGQTPGDWQITPLSGDHEMIVLDATLQSASVYGSAEAVASKTAEFASVDVVQWLNPDIDWGGMALTNPETGASEQYAPGEARITTVEGIAQHQQVTANDIPSLAGYTIA